MTALRIPHGDRVSLKACATSLRITEEGARRWCVRYGIGVKVVAEFPRGGTEWRISFPAARMIYARDFEALAALKAGDRTSALVAPYIQKSWST